MRERRPRQNSGFQSNNSGGKQRQSPFARRPFLSEETNDEQRSPFAPRPFTSVETDDDQSLTEVTPNWSALFETDNFDFGPPVYPDYNQASYQPTESLLTPNQNVVDTETSTSPELQAELTASLGEQTDTDTSQQDLENQIMVLKNRVEAEEALLTELLADMDITQTGSLQRRHDHISTLESTYDEYIALLMEAGYEEKAFNAHERIQTIEHVTLFEQDSQASLPETLDLAEVQNQILDEETAILEYRVSPRESYMWLITQDSFETYELPGEKSDSAEDTNHSNFVQSANGYTQAITGAALSFNLDETVSEHRREALETRFQRLERQRQTSGAETSRMLQIPELVKKLEDFSRIVVIPDGVLQHLPFSSLPIEPESPLDEGEMLIDRYEVVHLPSASSLLLSREELEQQEIVADVDQAKTIIFGISDFDQTDESDETYDWADLPGVTTEMQYLETAIPGEKTIVENAEVTLETIQDLVAGKYEIVHFSTHGAIGKLILSDGQESFDVTTEQIAAIDNMSIELLVLALCDSGMGHDDDGNLAIGRAFLSKQNISNIVTTLWDVDDRVTAEFTKYFYEKMYVDNLSAAKALRAAQLEMRDNNYAHPYYWSGFRFEGDWAEDKD